MVRSKSLKLAIVGAGVAGAYLYNLLTKQGFKIDLFDQNPRTGCRLRPCAWGTSRGFAELVKNSGLDPKKYFLKHLRYLVMDEYRIEADLTTVDKPRLLRDLRQKEYPSLWGSVDYLQAASLDKRQGAEKILIMRTFRGS